MPSSQQKQAVEAVLSKKEMYTQDNYERIQAWLDGDLPEDKRQAFEQQMETDEAFRREVKLHRQMQQTFSDPGLWRLQNTLTDMMKKPYPANEPVGVLPENPTRRWLFAGLLLVFAAVIGLAVWQWNKPAAVPLSPDIDNEHIPPTEPQAPIKPVAKNQTPTVKKPTENRPVAQINPSDFKPNEAMEKLVNGNFMGEGLTVKIGSPLPDADFVLNKKGDALVRFAGVIEDESLALRLSIFNNRESRESLLSIPFQPQKDAAGKHAFDFQQPLHLPPGLYYFLIEEKKSGALLSVGRFTIHGR